METPFNPMSFNEALVCLKSGCHVARAGWNGRDQYACLLKAGNAMYKGFPMQDCIALKNTQNKMQPGWVPSVSDLLAEDWIVV